MAGLVACPGCKRNTPAGIKCQYCGALLIEQIACEGCGRKLSGHITQCLYCGKRRQISAGAHAAAQAVGQRQGLSEQDLVLQLNRAIALIDRGRFDEAEQICARLEQLAPNEARATRLRAFLHQNRGELDLAERYFRLAVKQAPDDEHGWVTLAAFLNILKNYPEAVIAANRAIACRATFDEPYMIRAEALRGMRELDEAQESMQKACQLAPRSALNWFRLGELEVDRGQMGAALKAYLRAVAHLPEEQQERRAGIGKAILEQLADYPERQLVNMIALLVRLAEAGQPYPPNLIAHLEGAELGADADPPAPAVASSVAADEARPAPASATGRTATPQRIVGTAGAYRVHKLLGRGGFGEVYLVSDEAHGDVMALKLFSSDDDRARAMFRQEAETWVGLGAHPNLVRAHLVDEKHGRLFIGMEYVAPNGQGVNSLDGLLQRGRLDLAQTLRLAIQICHGLEHAYAHGVRAHRDLKPQNILLGDELRPKVADFGLALAGSSDGGPGGTPTHMPPEQWRGGTVDERADVYALGVILYQMLTGELPFLPRTNDRQRLLAELAAMHERAPIPKTGSKLDPIVSRCLQKAPEQRFPSVRALRGELHALYKAETGQILPPPDPQKLAIEEVFNKAVSLESIGKLEDAIKVLEDVIRREPTYQLAFIALGRILGDLGRLKEAEERLAQAVRLNPHESTAWTTVGNVKMKRGEVQLALSAYDRAIELQPGSGIAHRNRGAALFKIGRVEEAIAAIEHGLKLDPSSSAGWTNFGFSLHQLGRYREAIAPLRRACELDRNNLQALSHLAECLARTQQFDEALGIFDRIIALDPDTPDGYSNKGMIVAHLQRYDEAMALFTKAIALMPGHPMILNNRGHCLLQMGRYVEARRDFEKALAVDPGFVLALRNLGKLHLAEGRPSEALRYLKLALQTDGRDAPTLRMAGEALHRMALYDDALTVYERAQSIASDRATAARLELCRQRRPLP